MFGGDLTNFSANLALFLAIAAEKENVLDKQLIHHQRRNFVDMKYFNKTIQKIARNLLLSGQRKPSGRHLFSLPPHGKHHQYILINFVFQLP
ncbi:hypothetical protein OUZ56_012689 [Daphnia magna]|uniref:Uncharacterized protein n=1 Tax=Daphnia magna TaxID=35525 RepID=A0ABQ9Z3T0_9CRUS|nr:hypothetical protein OUZ56_012689 [Daphnia magna]